MSPAQADFGRAPSVEINREFTEAAPHPAGDPDRNLAQSSVEVPRVQLTMEALQAMEKPDISGTRSLGTRRSLRRRSIELYRKLKKLSLSRSPEHPRNPGIQKPDDCLQHPIRSEGVAPVDAENPPVEAEHHRLVRMGYDPLDLPQPERRQSPWKTVLE
jgi:hypothetical protein